MDIEQLKMILETVNQTTDGAKTIAIWYLAIQLLGVILKHAIAITAIVVTYKLLKPLAQTIVEDW